MVCQPFLRHKMPLVIRSSFVHTETLAHGNSVEKQLFPKLHSGDICQDYTLSHRKGKIQAYCQALPKDVALSRGKLLHLKGKVLALWEEENAGCLYHWLMDGNAVVLCLGK